MVQNNFNSNMYFLFSSSLTGIWFFRGGVYLPFLSWSTDRYTTFSIGSFTQSIKYSNHGAASTIYFIDYICHVSCVGIAMITSPVIFMFTSYIYRWMGAMHQCVHISIVFTKQ